MTTNENTNDEYFEAGSPYLIKKEIQFFILQYCMEILFMTLLIIK